MEKIRNMLPPETLAYLDRIRSAYQMGEGPEGILITAMDDDRGSIQSDEIESTEHGLKGLKKRASRYEKL